ncbi:MAG: prolyl aminopeptidase [Erysipelotrichaceae bacterium]|nr:prolyl aminopeptidase [Erysipelotrichaceae bacterium]
MKELIPDEYLDVLTGHKIAIYRKGNPDGAKVIYCHGGPGGRITESAFSFFDLYRFDVYAFDQRGCGKSLPFASVENNDINYLVEDIERIRKHYKLDKINLFGGSFGTTLALSYAIKYPQNVSAMTLRGIFLGRKSDIDWLYQEGASYYYPENFDKYRHMLPIEKQNDIVAGYEEIFQSNNQDLIEKAATAWANWEMGLVRLNPNSVNFGLKPKAEDISLSRLECHYFASGLGWNDDNYILNNVDKIKDIKITIVHGRYDIDCRPSGAYELASKLNNYELVFTLAGHGADDLDYRKALIDAANNMLEEGSFHHRHIDHQLFVDIKNKKINEFKIAIKVNDYIIFTDNDTLVEYKVKIKEIKDGVAIF